MKKYILLIYCLVTLVGYGQEMDKKLIKSFIDDYILKEKCLDLENINIYTSFNLSDHKDQIKRSYFVAYIQTKIASLKFDLMINNLDYNIISKQDIDESMSEINIGYKNYSNVYHLICQDKILTSFVIKEEKIISFFYYDIVKTENSTKKPFILHHS